MQHTDKSFDRELQDLKNNILKMGSLVEEMITFSMKSVVDRDEKVARKVIEMDPVVNQTEIAVDQLCLQLLALRQPAASDLRFITIGLRISKDLERMADLAVNVSEVSIELNKEPQLKPYRDLPMMGEKTRAMVKDALDAFVEQDSEKAHHVCQLDDEIDDLNRKIYRELVEMMKSSSEYVSRCVQLLFIARHYERIADHATNIAEEVIFMVKGQDIRHGQTQGG